jgi:hypothetical protein
MVAERITVGVFALDQVSVPRGEAGQGWAVRLAEQEPLLAQGATEQPVCLTDTDDGLILAGPADLAGVTHAGGVKVAVEQVTGRAGLFLVRIGVKPVAVAVAGRWEDALLPDHLPQPRVAVAAYAAGTLIDTPDGPRAVETLVAGDVVTTLANGSRPLQWVGRRQVSVPELLAHPVLRPVEFAAGAIGNTRPLLVSPDQRMLIDDWRAEVYFGEDRVLVAAKALVDDQAARVVVPEGGVTYVTLLCDRHEVLLAEGALSESFQPGEAGLSGLTPAERAEIEVVVSEADLRRRRVACPIVRSAEARALRL